MVSALQKLQLMGCTSLHEVRSRKRGIWTGLLALAEKKRSLLKKYFNLQILFVFLSLLSSPLPYPLPYYAPLVIVYGEGNSWLPVTASTVDWCALFSGCDIYSSQLRLNFLLFPELCSFHLSFFCLRFIALAPWNHGRKDSLTIGINEQIGKTFLPEIGHKWCEFSFDS